MWKSDFNIAQLTQEMFVGNDEKSGGGLTTTNANDIIVLEINYKLLKLKKLNVLTRKGKRYEENNRITSRITHAHEYRFIRLCHRTAEKI